MAKKKRAKVRAKHKKTKRCGKTFGRKAPKRKKKATKAMAAPFGPKTCPPAMGTL